MMLVISGWRPPVSGTVPEMLEDPHFQARQAITAVEHPDFGTLRMQNVAPKLSSTPGGVHTPSPALGQHNEEVYLQDLGLAPDEYRSLRERQII